MSERPTQQPRRLRKQPKRRTQKRRNQAANFPLPQRTVPRTARQRKRRNNRRVTLPTAAIRRFLFSPRWISLGLLALSVWALFTVGMEEQFYLTTIPVDGTITIPPGEIAAASQLGGAHIFQVDPNEAAQRIAEMPGVVSASVTLTWPNSVAVQIEEDSPIAVWQEQQNSFWITEQGRLVPARIDLPGLLIIEYELADGQTSEASIVGVEEGESEGVAADGPLTAEVAFVPDSVLEGAMQLRELRPNIERLYYRPSNGLSYQDGRGWRAYFGTGLDMEQKLVVYETIVDDLLARGVAPAYISVSNQEKPFYMGQ